MKRTFAPAFAALLACLSTAIGNEGKLTIQPDTFIIHESFHTTALPSTSDAISIPAKSWANFEITKLADHGASVKKGDVLIAFDPEELTNAIKDLQRTINRRELEIAAARIKLNILRETAEDRLSASRRAAEEAADNHKYHTETRHPLDVESAKQAVMRAEQRLRNANEELVQLKRMYEADDLVEETEEIILTRAKEAVDAAEFALHAEKIDQQRRINATLPRHLESLLETKKETARKLTTDKAAIPRDIILNEIELAQLETSQARDTKNLAELEADRSLLEITAHTDGIFYHGIIDNGEWTTPTELMRSLVLAGRPPVKRPLATFIPANTRIDLHALLTEATFRSFGGEKPKGLATLSGRGDLAIPVTLSMVSHIPNPAHRHHAVFATDWPKEAKPAPGASAEINIITYARDNAIVVPTNALQLSIDGWQVKLKLADGKIEKRPVTRGRTNGEKVEILHGLDPGQVIVLP